MQKGTKIALLVLGVLALVCVFGIASFYQKSLRTMEGAKADAKLAGDEILILLTGNWDTKAIELRTSPELQAKIDSGEFPARVAAWKAQFGSLASGEVQPSDIHATFDKSDSPKLVVKLAGRAKYEKGDAEVTMTLTREPRNAWLLSEFDLKPAK